MAACPPMPNTPNTPTVARPMRNRHFLSALGALLTTVLAAPAQAQMFKDPALQALYAAERTAELESLSQQRLARQADDAQAVLGLAMVALQADDAPRRDAALQRARACIRLQPQAAECQYALGVVLGVHAMSQGMVKAATSVGTVKDALLQALDAAPQWYPARSAVVEFHLTVPALMGGGASRAREVAHAALRSEQVQAFNGRIALADERPDAALALLQAVPTAADPALAEDVAGWMAQAAFQLLAKGQAAQARPVFERLQREHPGQAVPAYGLGQVHADLGAPADAVRWLEQAARLKGAAALPVDYRLGLALQADGRTEPARAALARFVAAGKGPAKSLDDAKKRLAQLGGAP